MENCKYCNGTNLTKEPEGQHVGLYCLDCKNDYGEPKWLKWIGKTETEEIATEAQQKYARHLLNKWRESKEPMLASEAGAIIGAFKARWDK